MGATVAENLVGVMERLRGAARKAGRDPSEITLIAVTKSVDLKKIKEAVLSGLRVFGENYVQEALEKVKKAGDKTRKWHFIGHLQKNKVKYAVELFDVIHTVDSFELAAEINKRAKKPIDILIQVNISGEKTKHGVKAKDAVKLAREVAALEKVRLRGLMAMPPYFENPELSRPYFITLRRLAERINREHIPGVFLHDLSIGMSDDFDVAIEEGATMVRVGRAIFGAREEKPEEEPPGAKPAKKAAKKAKPAKKAAKKAVKKVKPAKKAVKKTTKKAAAKKTAKKRTKKS